MQSHVECFESFPQRITHNSAKGKIRIVTFDLFFDVYLYRSRYFLRKPVTGMFTLYANKTYSCFSLRCYQSQPITVGGKCDFCEACDTVRFFLIKAEKIKIVFSIITKLLGHLSWRPECGSVVCGSSSMRETRWRSNPRS